MNELVYNKSFNEWETELKTEITRAADSFVRIGYLLKVARDTDILQGSGYSNVVEYAKAKYGLDKTQVSRFVSIHDRFGVEGSPELQEKYKNFGYSKLVIMLQLPNELNEELSPEYSKSEINALKTELDEEAKISDLEVYAESREASTQNYNLLEQSIYKICEDNIDTYKRLHRAITTDIGVDESNIVELLAPAGEKIYSVHITGAGRNAVSIKKDDAYIHTINLRTNEKENWTLNEAVIAVRKMIDNSEDDVKLSWQQLYNQSWPSDEIHEVAPVQQSPAFRKEKKVTTAKVDKPKPVEPPKPIEPVKTIEPEEQLPGQDTILNHPEYMPEDKVEMPTKAINTECENNSKEVIDVPARVVEENNDNLSPGTNAKSSEMITDKPDFEADMAAVESINEKEESDTDIRDGVIAMALNIAGVLQDRVNDDKIPVSMLNTLHSTAISISDKLEILMRRGEDNE